MVGYTPITGKKFVFRTLGFTLSTLGSVPSNVFKVPKSTVNTFDGTDPKVDRIKLKVRNTIFFPVNKSVGCTSSGTGMFQDQIMWI